MAAKSPPRCTGALGCELQVLDRRQATPPHMAGVGLGMYPGVIGQLGAQVLLQAQPGFLANFVVRRLCFERQTRVSCVGWGVTGDITVRAV